MPMFFVENKNFIILKGVISLVVSFFAWFFSGFVIEKTKKPKKELAEEIQNGLKRS